MKRFIYTLPALWICLSLHAQTATQNYVMTKTMLSNTNNFYIKNVQYYDGLGRPDEYVQGGAKAYGGYLYSRQSYDGNGRLSRSTLPAVGSLSPVYVSGLSTLLQQTYSDSHAYRQTTYDALDRPIFTSTPGDNWQGHGKSIRYVTNVANSVKKYSAGSIRATQQGFFPAGALTGEVVMDEDSVTVTTFKDLMGRVVLERRGDSDDTYYVYGNNGLLRFVLSPMYQEDGASHYRFRYDYDSKGRLTKRFLPGGGTIQYWYDSNDRQILLCDERLSAVYKNRFFLYDRLGRLVVQGTCAEKNSNCSFPVDASLSYVPGFAEVCNTGYYVTNQFTLSNPQIELVNYYDDYTFLTTTLCSGLTGSDSWARSNPSCATSLPTGTVTATSDGQLLLAVCYYDSEGRVIDRRERLLDGDFLTTTTTYSFTGKPVTTDVQLSGNNQVFAVNETLGYEQTTDQLTSHDVTFADTTVRVSSYSYDNLGRLATEYKGDSRLGQTYSYDLHGWLTATNASKLTGGYAQLFSQNLYYADGSSTPCYNGNISSMKWKTDGVGHAYTFAYDKRNRLTEASHANYNMSPLPYMYSETMTYNRNSAITSLTRTGNSQAGYGNMDFLSYSYTGNRLKSITDLGSSNVHDGAFEFVNGANSALEYYYNNAGDLTRDKNKGIALIQYDLLGHPTRVQFTNGNVTEYIYAADGRKLRTKHTTAVEGLTVPMGQTMDLTAAQTLAVDTTDCAGPWMFRRRGETNVTYTDAVSYHFDGGYITFLPELVQQPLIPVPAYSYEPSFHYYLRDHLGSNRMVVSGDGTIEQKNQYYPYGGPWGDISTYQGLQPFKYNGKELDRVHGLDWYDYGARRYDPAFAQFTQMDPLCEQYPHLSPYAYCAGNPVRYVDPDGRHIRVRKKGENYEVIEGGKVDDDLNIYDVTDGWENRVSFGKALSQYSFFNDDGKPAIGSIINLNDQSGQEFLTDFVNNTPSILNYMFNATKGEKYDFKQQNAPNPTIVSENMYNNRGMAISINGNDYIASARDIGNYAAGYIAGHNGLSWTEARLGFDALETRQHHFLPSIEGKPSRYAQFKGYTSGLKNLSLTKALKIRIIEYKMLKMLLP